MNASYRFYTRSIIWGAVGGLALVLAFAAGFLTREFVDIPQISARVASAESDGYPLLDEVQNLLDSVYLRDQPDYTERQYAAIRGMLGALEDPNTFFIEPPVAQNEADALAGTYGGIGVLLRRNEAGQFILTPYEDSPAAAAGIADGDVLLAINGEDVSLTTRQDSIDQQLRGEVKDGNGVEITVLKSDDETRFTVFVPFDVINVPSVIWRVTEEDQRIGYIQLLRFTNRTPGELEEAVNQLEQQGIEALLLDLRNNSGGLLQESVAVADAFIDGGVIVYEDSKESEETFNASNGSIVPDWPMVVLVNRRTASASELVAGALRDRERAILVGQQTFGKGTVQQIFSLSDGASIHVTSAEWFTPNRTPLDGVGLIPDISMIPDENNRDVETGEAIRYLQSVLEEKSSD